MSTDIALKVHSFIKEKQLIKENEAVVVGLSGGIDSMVLCDMLITYKREVNFRLFAAHMDHRLRDESGEDAFFVAAFCSKNNIPLYTTAADVMAEAVQTKTSVETAARYMRHGFFKTVLNEHAGAKLALAHHMNDMAETILMRLIRGSSIDGLAPMPAKDKYIIRPLMCLSRDEIEEYAEQKGIKWREDKTNTDTQYTRNYIRHELIPQIEKHINPSVVYTLCNQAKSYKEDSEYILDIAKAKAAKAKITDDGYMMEDEDFMYLSPSIRKRVIKMLFDNLGKSKDLYEKNINAVDALFSDRRTGAVIEIPGEYEARAHVMGVELIKKENAKSSLEETIMAFDGATYLSTGDMIICEMAEKTDNWNKHHSKNVQYIDYLKLQEQPVIRAREKGDVIYPLGAPGKKKLKDYFIDKKINRWERDSIPLIAIGSEIIWVVGAGVSEKYKIDDTTTLALKISYKKGEYNE